MLPSTTLWGSFSDPVVSGREDLLARKVEALIRGKENNLSIIGPFGIGKTTFASALAQHPRVMKRFKDGILWVNLGRNSDPSVTIAGWARNLGIDLIRNATFESRVRAIKQAICSRRFLTILDDVEDLEIAYSLGCGMSGCKVIVISEFSEIGKTFAGRRYCIELNGLDSENSFKLVKSRNQDCLEWKTDQIIDVINACCGNPLLLLRIAAYLYLYQELANNSQGSMKSPAISYASFSEKFLRCSGEIQKLNIVTESILGLLPWSTVASLYRLGAFAPDPALFDRDAAITICGLGSEQVQKFIDLNLISTRGNSLCLSNDVADLIHAKTPRTANEHHRKYYHSLLTSFPKDQGCVESIYEQVKWILKSSATNDFDPPLFVSLADYLEEHGLWEDYLEVGEIALQDARWVIDNNIKAKIYTRMARVHSILQHKDKALDYYQRALSQLEPMKSGSEVAQILNNIGTIYASLAENEKAIHYLREASTVVDGMNNPVIDANIYNNLGKVEFDLGLYSQAIDVLDKAARLIPELEDPQLIINIRSNLAKALYSKGELTKSTDELRQVVEIEKEIKGMDIDQDIELLSEIEAELAKPRLVRWIRRKIFTVQKIF